MNDTKIETTDCTWNPVVGCKRHCPYCYARSIATQLYGSFEPRLFEKRLIEPRRVLTPRVVFVVNMGDLWGDWVPATWIEKVLAACRAADWHVYQFYTKDPSRYSSFLDKLPPRAWLGCTIDAGFDVDARGKRSLSPTNEERVELLNRVNYPRKFVSIEPFDPNSMDFYREMIPKMNVQWAHVGFRTFGGGRIDPRMPKWAWNRAAEICMMFDKLGIPVFPKDSIAFTDPDPWRGKWERGIPAGVALQSKQQH
ncbi:MAG: DUF5131 family protein [Candidatus Sigynarchaeota archaeon]